MPFESDEGSSSEQKTSKYNEAINQLARLNELWTACNTLSCKGNLVSWKWNLDAIWRELSADAFRLDENSYEKIWKKELKEVNKEISKCKNPTELYNALNNKEEFLRRLQFKAGKSGKLESTDDEDND